MPLPYYPQYNVKINELLEIRHKAVYVHSVFNVKPVQ